MTLKTEDIFPEKDVYELFNCRVYIIKKTTYNYLKTSFNNIFDYTWKRKVKHASLLPDIIVATIKSAAFLFLFIKICD